MVSPAPRHASDEEQNRSQRTPPDAAAATAGCAGASDGKRVQILVGARQVFRSQGFDAASMDAIARAAGVSKGTLYVYFSSKEGLFADLVRADMAAAAEQLAVLDTTNPDVRAVLRAYGVSFVRRMQEPDHIAMVRMVIAASVKLPELGRVFYEAGPGHGVSRLASYLSERTAQGQLRTPDPVLAAAQFYELVQGAIVKPLFFAAPSDTSEAAISQTVESALDIFLGYYAGDGR